MRILLAEDAALLREGLVSLLERAGHEVAASVSTATELLSEAPALLAGGRADLLLADVRMPPGHGDDGLRAALELRRDHPRLPVLVLSQYVEQRYASALLGLGASRAERPRAGTGYLLKDRVSRVHDFLHALETVRAGGFVVDPAVVSSLMDPGSSALAALSPREREVLELVSEGRTNEQIADSLHVSRGAVVKHVSAVFDKLGLSEQDGNRRVMAVLAYMRGSG
jgi:DNA-binding NarL/FixJ family response regulator